MKILFVSGEVKPFVQHTANAELLRQLPEYLNDLGNYEIRIMMPRYGTISERKNRLHEVIRLSGTSIQIGNRSESFAVKVASIPGIRLQVYFMDNNFYFKRKGIFADKEGKIFTDNEERALYFAHAALATTKNLGWKPDVIHTNGWMSAMVPYLVRTKLADSPLFEQSRIVHTPDEMGVDVKFSAAKVKQYQLGDERLADLNLNKVASLYSDALAFYTRSDAERPEGALELAASKDELLEVAVALYQQLVGTGALV
ncbi:MAG TPA: glycogen/starch synthase [Rhodothermales bacterium]|nr:glycogen/starch synthase [Rhodothermales bacterium]